MELDQHNYKLYKNISETIGHIPLPEIGEADEISWIDESNNFCHFYEMESLQEVHDHINIT